MVFIIGSESWIEGDEWLTSLRVECYNNWNPQRESTVPRNDSSNNVWIVMTAFVIVAYNTSEPLTSFDIHHGIQGLSSSFSLIPSWPTRVPLRLPKPRHGPPSCWSHDPMFPPGAAKRGESIDERWTNWVYAHPSDSFKRSMIIEMII